MVTMRCAEVQYTLLAYTAMWPGLYAAGLSAGLPADLLRVARRGLRDKGRAALGTSAARGHRASVAPLRILAAFPATRWITLRPPDRARSPGHVAHDPAAKWIRGTRPLKVRNSDRSRP